MKSLTAFFLFIWSCSLPAQDTLTVYFRPLFADAPLESGRKYCFQNDTIEIETLRFYISDMGFYKAGELVSVAEKKYHLLDFENPASLQIRHILADSLDTVKFKIGIDSLTNVSGVLGGDLDPVNGMYWTWQSGYINFKLEGRSMRCPARNHRFQLHIGGYRSPFNALQEIELEAKNETIVIGIPIDELLQKIDVSSHYEVMSPNQRAVDISTLIASVFKISE